MKQYVSLHAHTSFSALDGVCSPASMVAYCKSMGMSACGISDHGSLNGIPSFFEACREHKMKPILGCEFYYVPDRHIKSVIESPTGRKPKNGYHLTVFAKNLQGYKNLVQLNNIANLEGFYYTPKIDWESLSKYSEGLIIGLGCVGSEFSQHCLSDKDPRKIATRFKDVFGDRLFIEAMDSGMVDDIQRNINKRSLGVARSVGIRVVATNDSHYLSATDQKFHEVLLAMHSKKTMSDPTRFHYDGLYSVRSFEEMERIFPDFMSTSLEVADMVEEYDIFSKEMHMPVDTEGADQVLRMMSHSGLITKGINTPEYKERLNSELAVIEKLKMAPYMLTVRDVVDTIKAANCPLGYARGSAGGSLTSYALGITNIDPLKYDLLFERFLNLSRADPADIDLDLGQSKREEVINKLIEKHGKDKVSYITTYSTLKAKMLIRDICRTTEQSTAVADRLSGLVPWHIEKVDELDDTQLAKELKSTTEGTSFYEMIKLFYGNPRHAGVHASGIILSSVPISDIVPVRMDKERLVAQYTMDHIYKFGLLKLDLLGLKKLDVVHDTAEDAHLDLSTIPENDQKTFSLLGSGRVEGVFQLDASKNGAELTKRLHPINIEELGDLVAINRPAVLDAGLHETYFKRKDGLETFEYLHPDLKSILEKNYGVFIYQEQIMLMAKVFAGFTLEEAENLRYGIAKKKAAVIEKIVPKFKAGALKLGRSEESINKVIEQIEASARYGFNKAHSVGYGHLTYITAYLSANYPLEFFKNLINKSEEDDRAKLMSAALMRRIKILPPDINTSAKECTLEGRAIRLGLMSMKGIGDATADKIISKRPYSTMKDVHTKCSKSVVTILYSAKGFGSVSDGASYSSMAKLNESDILGISLSGLGEQYQDVMDHVNAVPFPDLDENGGTCIIKIGTPKKILDRNLNPMAFLDGVDSSGIKVEGLVVFKDLFASVKIEAGVTYSMFLSRSNKGGWIVKFMQPVEEIRKAMKEQANG